MLKGICAALCCCKHKPEETLSRSIHDDANRWPSYGSTALTPSARLTHQHHESNVQEYNHVKIGDIGLPVVAVILKKSEAVYNEYVDKHVHLEDALTRLTSSFPVVTDPYTTSSCLQHIVDIGALNGTEVTIRRPKKCKMLVVFERDKLLADVIQALDAFNEANDVIDDIVTQHAAVARSLDQVIRREGELRQEVVGAALGSEGPTSLKHTIDGLAQLKRARVDVDRIRDDALATFEDLKRAARTLVPACYDNDAVTG